MCTFAPTTGVGGVLDDEKPGDRVIATDPTEAKTLTAQTINRDNDLIDLRLSIVVAGRLAITTVVHTNVIHPLWADMNRRG